METDFDALYEFHAVDQEPIKSHLFCRDRMHNFGDLLLDKLGRDHTIKVYLVCTNDGELSADC